MGFGPFSLIKKNQPAPSAQMPAPGASLITPTQPKVMPGQTPQQQAPWMPDYTGVSQPKVPMPGMANVGGITAPPMVTARGNPNLANPFAPAPPAGGPPMGMGGGTGSPSQKHQYAWGPKAGGGLPIPGDLPMPPTGGGEPPEFIDPGAAGTIIPPGGPTQTPTPGPGAGGGEWWRTYPTVFGWIYGIGPSGIPFRQQNTMRDLGPQPQPTPEPGPPGPQPQPGGFRGKVGGGLPIPGNLPMPPTGGGEPPEFIDPGAAGTIIPSGGGGGRPVSQTAPPRLHRNLNLQGRQTTRRIASFGPFTPIAGGEGGLPPGRR